MEAQPQLDQAAPEECPDQPDPRPALAQMMRDDPAVLVDPATLAQIDPALVQLPGRFSKVLQCTESRKGGTSEIFTLMADGTVFYEREEQRFTAREPDVDAFMTSLAPMMRDFCKLEEDYRVESMFTCKPITAIRVAHGKEFNHEVSVYNHQNSFWGMFYGPGSAFHKVLKRLRDYSHEDATPC